MNRRLYTFKMSLLSLSLTIFTFSNLTFAQEGAMAIGFNTMSFSPTHVSVEIDCTQLPESGEGACFGGPLRPDNIKRDIKSGVIASMVWFPIGRALTMTGALHTSLFEEGHVGCAIYKDESMTPACWASNLKRDYSKLTTIQLSNKAKAFLADKTRLMRTNLGGACRYNNKGARCLQLKVGRIQEGNPSLSYLDLSLEVKVKSSSDNGNATSPKKSCSLDKENAILNCEFGDATTTMALDSITKAKRLVQLSQEIYCVEGEGNVVCQQVYFNKKNGVFSIQTHQIDLLGLSQQRFDSIVFYPSRNLPQWNGSFVCGLNKSDAGQSKCVAFDLAYPNNSRTINGPYIPGHPRAFTSLGGQKYTRLEFPHQFPHSASWESFVKLTQQEYVRTR